MADSEQRQQPLLNNTRLSTDAKPEGRAFCIKAPDRAPIEDSLGCGRFIILLIIAPIASAIGCIICLYYWASGDHGYSYPSYTALFAFLAIILFGIDLWLFGQCPFQRNGEKWLYYEIRISLQEQMVYILTESTKKRWKILLKIAFSDLRSIGATWRIQSRGMMSKEEAWIILTLSNGQKKKMNRVGFQIDETKQFVQAINNYLEQIYKQRQIEARQHNREFIQQLIQNGVIIVREESEDAAGDMDRGGSLSQAAAPAASAESGDNLEQVVIEESETSATSKKCANCGEMMSIGHKFCNNCGKEAGFDKDEEMKCVKCNGLISKKSKFCPNCGTKTNEVNV